VEISPFTRHHDFRTERQTVTRADWNFESAMPCG